MDDVSSEMVVFICSPASLSKCVCAVVPSGIDRFVVAVCLNLLEELEVPLSSNCSKYLETPVDEVLVRRRRDGRVREINRIEGVGCG